MCIRDSVGTVRYQGVALFAVRHRGGEHAHVLIPPDLQQAEDVVGLPVRNRVGQDCDPHGLAPALWSVADTLFRMPGSASRRPASVSYTHLALERLYRKDGFQMAVVYGRRRVGKTTLIDEFAKSKPSLFFTAQEKSAVLNLRLFSHCLLYTSRCV